MSPDFQLVSARLRPGTTLLQASAGTGKTHTLAGIFLRLVVELEMEVDEILVVTFTDAATEELRGRIRDVLAQALAEFQSGTSKDELIAALLVRVPDRARATARLRESLNAFDLAPIFTLHGFCQRLLRDRAFESGSLFDVELVTDQAELLREVADDFWRRHFYAAAPLHVALARREKFSADTLLGLLRTSLNHHDVKLVSGAGKKSADELARAAATVFAKAAKQWREHRERIIAKLGSHTHWATKPYNSDELMAVKFAALDAVFAGQDGEAKAAVLGEFTASAFAKCRSTAKNADAPPTDPFFDACEELFAAAQLWLTALRRDFLTGAGAELEQRKQRMKVRSYDDLLTRSRGALRGEGGGGLVREVRSQFKAALIDEFQDTDPVQWEIFRTLFAAESGDSIPFLFLIGDPKQAIYSFRGADIFTYLSADATTDPDARFTLGVNWRSESGLVHALNAVFSHAKRAPFVFDDIPFQPVKPSPKADAAPLTIAGEKEPPLQMWFLPRDQKVVGKGDAESRVIAAVAGEIVKLLQSDARIGARPVRCEDITVLAMTNAQADLVQQALAAAGVPCVLHTERSVFHSPEAADLLRVLNAIGSRTNEKWLRAALATPLLGEDAAKLAAYEQDEAAWQHRRARFDSWFEVWEERGFALMFRLLLAEEGVRARLLSSPGGERSLTNLLHLGELLHRAGAQERLGVGGLLKWFAAQLAEESVTADEHQLRLERDDNAVRIVTVHKSKGLQYGIVFAPFCWRGSEVRADDVTFRDAPTQRRVRDLGPVVSAEHAAAAERERLAENVRLLYVALTRAVHRCHFAWGAINGAETSAPAWLLHGHRAAADKTFALDWAAVGDEMLRDDFRALAQVATPHLAIEDLPGGEGAIWTPAASPAEDLKPRIFFGVIADDWRIASFSSLTATGADERPDYDSTAWHEPDEPASGIFAFPRGARAGTCLHKIFEELDFATSDQPAVREIIADQLRYHGYSDDDFGDDVAAMVRRVLGVPLDGVRQDFTLSRVTERARLNELEFYFPTKKFSPGVLAEVFSRHVRAAGEVEHAGLGERLTQLGFAPTGGFMNGFVDLVFRFDGKYYLADWKSNWLGSRVEDYSQAAMAAEMVRNHYTLQYHLYVVALNRWLATRVPGYDYEKHFGGVFYLFLRGVEPARPEFGVFRDRPAAKLITELSAALMVEPTEAVR